MQGRRHPEFRLVHSNALEVLAGVLAERLRAVPADGDWLRPDTVLVPQFAMRRWLQQFLAEANGICANVRFLAPGEFVDAALDANLGRAAIAERLRPQALRWRLLRELRADPPAAYAGFLGDRAAPGEDVRKAWSLACALAESYEKYQAWRRDLLLRWEAGADRDDAQAQLWRRVARGRAHRARRIGDYLQRFGAGAGAVPAGLPPRLFVFACQNVSPDVLQVIASQARAGTQEFFLHTPSRAFWGDLARWAAEYLPAADDSFAGVAPNPLLAAWGQAGRDFIATLGSGEAVRADYEARGFAEPARTQLLGRLQADVLDNLSPEASQGAAGDAAWPRSTVDRGDPSLQFHACHTRLREVQVLHDQLRALLEAPGTPGEPRLEPRDIAVLAPDIDLYAPHIEAVFGGALGSARELPYTLADTSPLAVAPLAQAFTRLLELPLRPLRLADLVDLLAVPAIAERFGVDDDARANLQTWLAAAGARWGLDGEDRARHAAGAGEAYGFRFATDRLLLGYASGADDDIAGVAPWPELEGQSAAALDAGLRLLALLRDAAATLAGPHPPQAWATQLERLLAAVFGDEPRDPGERRTLARIRDAVAAFAEGAAEAGYTDPVEHAVLRDQLLADLHDVDARAPFLSGGVCFGRMVPMRLIPFRVVCLLGMDDGAFPARDARDPLNRIERALDTPERRVGDPSRRDADRYLFLQLFTSASRVFYLSWLGFDPRDGSACAPASVVAELLDVAARYHAGDAAAIRAALVVRHALQPFSPAAFGAAHVDEQDPDPRRFSFDGRWRAAADSDIARVESPPFAVALPPRPREAATAVSLEQLRGALARPQLAYLRDGLGLRLPEEEPPQDAHEPFGRPDPLQNHGLRQQAFEAWLASGDAPDADALQARLLARAQLAPGADGRVTVATVLAEVGPFARAALAAGFRGRGEQRPLEAELDGTRFLASLAGVYPQGLLRVALRDDGLHGGHVLRHRLDALAGSLLGLPLHVLSAPGKGRPPVVETFPALAPADAAAVLRALLALRETLLRAPLPFLPKSGYAFRAAADVDSGLRQARAQWLGNDFGLYAEADAATALALRGADPFLDRDPVARDRFVRASRAIFAALLDARPFDPGALA